MSKGQRRKGNAKAASSAQAAELLGILARGEEETEDRRIEIALKKAIKKDAVTREKGLKELIRLIDEASAEDSQKSFINFVALFPKLSLDGTVSVRSNAVRVLAAYIKKLQKHSERYMKKVLPYVLFLTHDGYVQIANGSKAMLANCFPDGKYDIVMKMCKEPICEISLQLLNGTHLLSKKGEGEETEDQRYVRLASQSLQCLQWLCTESLSEEQRQQMLQLFSRSSLKHLLSSSPQVVSGMFILASSFATVTNEWEAITGSGIPVAALAHLDDTNRGVCRASANFVLQMAKSKELFNALDIDKAVVPRIISLIRRKDNHWNHISTSLVPIVKAILIEKKEADGQALLLRILDAFFDGIPWDQSFPNIIWVNTFEEFAELGSWWAVDRCTSDLDIIMDEFVMKVWIAMKYAMKWGDKSLIRKVAHIPERIIKKCTSYPRNVSRIYAQIQEHLLSGLPSTKPIIEELFCDKVEPVWSSFVENLFRSAFVSQKLLSHLLEKCSDNILEEINARFPLCRAVSRKIDWDEDENTALHLLKLLIKFTTKFGERITEFYKVDDELSSIRFFIAFGSLGEKEKHSAVHLVDDELVLERATQFCVRQVDKERWDILLDNAQSFPCFETVLDQVLEKNHNQVDQQLLIAVLNKQGLKIGRNLQNKLVGIIIRHLFETEPSPEVIHKAVEIMVSSGVDLKLVATIIMGRLQSTSPSHYDYSDVDVATTIASFLPFSSAADFIVGYADLIEKCAALDKQFGLEIVETKEYLASPVIIISLLGRKTDSGVYLLPYLAYALFLMNYLDTACKEHIGDCRPTFLFAVAVFSLASMNTVNNGEVVEARTSMESLIKREILENEELGESLLSECIMLVARGNGSLCLLAALRTLADGLRIDRVEALFRDVAENMDRLGIMLCSAALRLQDFEAVFDKYCGYPVSVNDWIGYFEVTSSWKESVSCLRVLAHFMVEGRSTLEEYLFAYSYGTEEEEERNVFNCALLRFLSQCCHFLRQMDIPMRDFLCCALVTSLESANAVWGQCKSQSFMLFSSMSVRLFNECAKVIESTRDDVELAHFRQEWSDFFSSAARNILLVWFLGLASCEEDTTSKALQNALCLSVNYITEGFIRTATLPPVFDAELDHLNYDEHLQSVVIPIQTLISSSFLNVQLAALKIMKFVTGDMLEVKNKCDEENDPGDEKLPTSCYQKQLPVPFTKILDDPVAGNCVLSPKLLIWDVFVSSLSQFELLQKVGYCNAMSPYMDQIMPHLFSLLPDSNTHVNISSVDVVDITKPEYWEEMKSAVPRYAFRLFYDTCAMVPAMVRQWYMKLPRTAATLFSAYVTKSVSPLIWRAECDQFASRKMPNKLKVRLLRAARQIVAEYDLEDSMMTLIIEYPVDYPLSVPLIDSERAIVSKGTSRKWLLQLTMFLTHQNGSVVDAVLMWVGNIERHLDGAEDCTICMMTVHSRTYQLPRVRCKQCRKRFHSDCLYKWFDSSNQSTCPLCRASFR